MKDRLAPDERIRSEVYSPKRVEAMDGSLRATMGDSKFIVVIHTRPMLPLQRAESWRSQTRIIEIVSVGSGSGVVSMDTDSGSTPDLPFTPESLATVEHLVGELGDERLTIIAPYIKYAPSSWDRLIHGLEDSHNVTLVAVNPKHLELIEGKRFFGSIMREAGVAISQTLEFTGFKEFENAGGWGLVMRTFGSQFVVQVNDSAGGSGTRLVGLDHSVEDAEEMVRHTADGWFKVTTFHHGYETNGAAVVLPDGRVYIDPLSRKPVSESIREVFGGKKAGAIGDDWSFPWSGSVQLSYIDVMVRTGGYLHNKFGYVGIFGVDSIVNDKVEPHEINARPQGTTRHHHMRAQILGRPSTWYLHTLALAGCKDFSWLPDQAIWNTVVASETGGWQVDIVPRTGELGKIIGRNANGRYKLNDQGLTQRDDGDIWIVAPGSGQLFDWSNKEGRKRLTSHGQIYYVNDSSVQLPNIFDIQRQEATPFGRKFATDIRELIDLQ